MRDAAPVGGDEEGAAVAGVEGDVIGADLGTGAGIQGEVDRQGAHKSGEGDDML